MSVRTHSAPAGTCSALRRFLRETWLSRVYLPDWLRAWAGLPVKRRHQFSKPRKCVPLGLETCEFRGGPDDFLAILQSGWLGAGGALLTPGLVLLKGWAAGQFADAGARADIPFAPRVA